MNQIIKERMEVMEKMSGRDDDMSQRRALWRILASMDGLYNRKELIYDFETGYIKPEVLDEIGWSSGEGVMIRFGFNLFTGGYQEANVGWDIRRIDSNCFEAYIDALYLVKEKMRRF